MTELKGSAATGNKNNSKKKKEMQKSFRSCGSCSILFNIYDPVLVFSINQPTNPQSALSALILCESEAWTNERIHRFCGFDFHTVNHWFRFFFASTRVEWTVKQVVVVIFMCAGFLTLASCPVDRRAKVKFIIKIKINQKPQNSEWIVKYVCAKRALLEWRLGT